ncbi:MAG TPA: carboxypeptidase-like regulatory domain-containing protein [bacterium]|nr:carboxypeptidase-like regulatory domain-containing protein [bacterium]HPN45162.1 carboxypeptidase-like regulatory domain-containing protein [bacterium]
MILEKGIIKLVCYGLLVCMAGWFSCTEDPVEPETNGAINGQVLDAESNLPVAGASITTSPASDAVITDADGKFFLTDISENTYIVKAVKTGYKSGSVSVEVKQHKTAIATILLTKSAAANNAPTIPSKPVPANGAVNQPISLSLTWSSRDPDDDDTLSFDIYLGNGNSAFQLISSQLQDTSYALNRLLYNTTYHWQIVARDLSGTEINGPAWSFTTLPLPDYPILFAGNSDGDYNIYSGNTAGTDSILLTWAVGRDWYPKLCPTRDKIAFTSDRDIVTHIYTMNRDGANVQKITTTPVDGYFNYGRGFCWAGNGQKILYANYNKLYQIDATGGQLQQIATAPDGRHFRDLDWTSVSNKIVALTIGEQEWDSEIYLVNPDNGDLTLVVENLPGIMGHPSFSPAGDKIVYYRDVAGHQVSSGRMLDAQLIVVNISSGDTTNISSKKTAGTNDLDPVWSPDGGKILFTNVANDNSTASSVWVMDSNGENRKQLYTNAQMADWR